MSNSVYLITGPSGSGKTAVSVYLAVNGYRSIDADSTPGLCYFVNKNGKPVPYPADAGADWWTKNNYVWELDRLNKHLRAIEPTTKPVFLCGNAGNINKAWPIFAGAFYLDIPEDVMQKRIHNTAGDENFGQRVTDQSQLLRWAGPFKTEMLELGAVSIDATKPVNQVAKDILDHIQANPVAQ